MKTINLLVGGPTDLWPDSLRQGKIDGDWIGVDRGNVWLVQMGIKPLISIGDFDSMDQSEFEIISNNVSDIRTYNPDKDYTDTQLALKIASDELKADVINIFGATGGRIDHFISNYLLATEPKFRDIVEKIRIIDKQNVIQYFTPGKYEIRKIDMMHYLAFIPMNAMHLSIHDAVYKLDNYYVERPFAYSSNQFDGDKCHFDFDDGVLCVIQSKDA
ncbi:Thiamine pyrophosphokinase [Apilactobacillus kunkeei]|uniref:Thiamine diphosphokinase n=1 Tax=Apilactobacillus nanyangensis TaxID=2799579 RepID=A0ABT0HZR4_9LACO|nr:thiamine diphosphokinase [Apilactobacillus nanyangensis]MCK8611829.1 thiamine diphosphokinase [Apilactobacillus nanyangensis]TMT01629.1 thiamine diphosphokinase [Apilactobacillus kunkeei]TMT03770.1 thiamine diphosphokinase [Apilactobacillus kunkeei]CAI2674961.1 Thiamine pyrophosphokinase [Apilactobacillus kunkeei]